MAFGPWSPPLLQGAWLHPWAEVKNCWLSLVECLPGIRTRDWQDTRRGVVRKGSLPLASHVQSYNPLLQILKYNMTLVHPYSLGPMIFEDFSGLGGLIMISRKPSPSVLGGPRLCDMCGDGAPRDLRWQQGQYVLCISIWVNYKRPHCDLTGIMVNKGNHPQMALFQVSELI